MKSQERFLSGFGTGGAFFVFGGVSPTVYVIIGVSAEDVRNLLDLVYNNNVLFV